MRAMILAAGRGERLRPLTDRVPKPLVEVGGTPLVVRAIERLRAAGITELVINLGWLGEQIRDRLGTGRSWGVEIAYSEEGEDTLETGGGIVKALPLLGPAPFWVLSADLLCDYAFPVRALAPGDLAHLLLVDNPVHHPGGDFDFEAGRIAPGRGERLTYAGVGLLHPDLFAGCPRKRFSYVPLLRRAARAGRVGAERYRGLWLDVGIAARLAAARKAAGGTGPAHGPLMS